MGLFNGLRVIVPGRGARARRWPQAIVRRKFKRGQRWQGGDGPRPV